MPLSPTLCMIVLEVFESSQEDKKMASNLVVCRYIDRAVIKGSTHDFAPNKLVFHVQVKDEEGDVKTVDVPMAELKAVFFVKSLEGKKDYEEERAFTRPSVEPKIVVEFSDNERIVGTTSGYSHDRSGFFVSPVDFESNNLRIYVVAAAVKKVLVGAQAEEAIKDMAQQKNSTKEKT